MTGTTPRGITDERAASEWVRRMFGAVAHRYDLLNHLLSFNIDRRWRSRTVAAILPLVARPDARVLDLCCGTGDLAAALESAHGGPVIAADFARPMLDQAARKLTRRKLRTALLEADALALPFADQSLDVIAVAFGLRNFAHYRKGLAEMRRVLRPAGTAAILEFSQPPNALFNALYRFYSHRVLPRVGRLVSGSREAYSYLPESVRRFPGADELAAELTAAGFPRVRFERLTGGIVALHIATA